MLKIYTFLKTLLFAEPSVDTIISPITKIAAKLDKHAVAKSASADQAREAARLASEKVKRDAAESTNALIAADKFRSVFGAN